MKYIQNLTADWHILVIILVVIVFGTMGIWAGWSFLKMFLNMFGLRKKQIEVKKV